MNQGSIDRRMTKVVVLEVDREALLILRRGLEHGLGERYDGRRQEMHAWLEALEQQYDETEEVNLGARRMTQPACGSHAPHAPHNGFASERSEPWCTGLQPYCRNLDPHLPHDYPLGGRRQCSGAEFRPGMES